MTQFIIHIGPPNTGARSLQQAFAAAASRLADRGVLYPPIWGEGAHDELPAALSRLDPTLERGFAELRDSGYPVVLLSAERLFGLTAASIEYFRTLIQRKNPARIVFYARSWADLLSEQWKRAVMAGSTQTFREFLLAFADNPDELSNISFARLLRPYAAGFGRYAIDIVPYDAVLAERSDLFRHFAETFLDWSDPPALDLPPADVLPGAAETEVVRTLHALETARLGHAPPRLRAQTMSECYLRDVTRFAVPALERALAENTAMAPFNEDDLSLAQLHRELFNEFREAVVEPRPLGVFFQPRRVEIPYIGRDFLLAPGVAGELRQLHERLLADMARPDLRGAGQEQARA